MKIKLTLSCITVLFSVQSMAQEMQEKHLKDVTVAEKRAVPERLAPIEGTMLYAGKKNEVIRLSAIDANLTNGNTRQIFGRVPGVSQWEIDGSGAQVSIGLRGLNPNRSWEINTRQNGYDISADVFGYPEAYYNPPMEAVEKIDVVRGGAALQFGSQFGGLLNYVLKQENEKKPFSLEVRNTVGSYGLFNSFIAARGNSKKWKYSIYHDYRTGDGWRQNGSFQVRNAHGYLQYKINDKTNISLEYTNMNYVIQQAGGLNDLQFKNNSRQSIRERNWFSAPWNVAALIIDSKPNNRLQLNMKVFGLLSQRNSIGFLASPAIADTVNTSTNNYNPRQVDRDFYKNGGIEIRAVYKYQLRDMEGNLAVGARLYQANTLRKQKGKGDSNFEYNTNISTNRFPTELEFQTTNVAVFAENQMRIGKLLTISPGLRFEHIQSDAAGLLSTVNSIENYMTPQNNVRNFVLAGLSIEYNFGKQNLYANISQAYRPVLFSDLVPSSTTDVIDQNLHDANGFNADIGFRGSVSNVLSFDASVFYLQYNDRIGSIRQFVNNDPANDTYLYRTNLGSSSNQGIELYLDFSAFNALNISKNAGNLNLFASMAFIRAQYKDFRITSIEGSAPNITITEKNLRGNQVEYAPNQIHTLGITYAIAGFSATLQNRISSAIYTDATNTENPNASATIGKIDGYEVFDLSLEYRIKKNYDLRLSINNLGNEVYATRRASGYPGPGLIPAEGRTINVGVGIRL